MKVIVFCLEKRADAMCIARCGIFGQRVRKVVTTTFTYDNNGNVTQKTVDGTTTTYVYDYAGRLTALGVLGATTTYAYDRAGNRVSQAGTSTTFIYPFKWYCSDRGQNICGQYCAECTIDCSADLHVRSRKFAIAHC